jgi:transcriptional regulator with XRE-family HTH domain
MGDYAEELRPQGENLAEYVAKVRMLRGLTKTELARRANVHITSLVNLEKGLVKGQKVKTAVQSRIAAALQIPVEYLKAACTSTPIEIAQTNQVCFTCWSPGSSPDTRWSFADAKFCLRCGSGLQHKCSCGEPLLLRAKFCPECGRDYKLRN